MGFDFTLIAPLLLSHCGFSFVFGCGVSFLVRSSVFLSMTVQQLVVIPVFSQEGVRARPSTPPSWFLPSPFISFSSLIAVAKPSKTMLNNSGESGQPCLVLDLRGNGFSFSPFRTMLAVSLSYMAFIILR